MTHPMNSNPWPAAFVNFKASIHVFPVSIPGNQSFLEWRMELLTEQHAAAHMTQAMNDIMTVGLSSNSTLLCVTLGIGIIGRFVSSSTYYWLYSACSDDGCKQKLSTQHLQAGIEVLNTYLGVTSDIHVILHLDVSPVSVVRQLCSTCSVCSCLLLVTDAWHACGVGGRFCKWCLMHSSTC